MSLEGFSTRDKYIHKADTEGFVRVGDFATQELNRQAKNIAAFLDGDEGTNPDINLGEGVRFKGSSGNYSDVKVHIDDLEKFINRIKAYYR